ncbi:hypothetical protein [Pseudolactococcus insecticola]|uniref:Uncharacterized protein n=1 Tax=Pseudolactococcus insecticola TaxID=2709158 RepID=A0A6A0BC68_9LACT|nr:hypothetical protein [Lactococcus insecticola]GFH41417.1 hypothetical protein Hs20B_18150 [Lactococcus insecticola]
MEINTLKLEKQITFLQEHYKKYPKSWYMQNTKRTYAIYQKEYHKYMQEKQDAILKEQGTINNQKIKSANVVSQTIFKKDLNQLTATERKELIFSGKIY